MPLLPDPIWVYNDWSAYDELSDNIPLTEALAIRELDQVLRLREFGAHFDYYMMDAFWFDPDGAYRTWRKPNWPDGPDRWIAACRAHGLLPGLWFGSNALVKINPAPAWRDSLNTKGSAMSFSEGGFLPDLMKTLDYWYGRGIRMFEFDFADFTVATPAAEKNETPEDIERRNQTAFRGALQEFRRRHPDIVLVAFNGFGGDLEYTSGHFPFRHPIDLRWLAVFDSLYAGDPRPSDVPETSFWRSVDVYSDHMVRRYEQSFVPLERIDPTSVMFGNTGTIYYRKTHAWKGELLLMISRGGWVNTIHGNLEFLNDDDARWFAKVQGMFAPPDWKYMHPILVNKQLVPYRDDTGRVTADAPADMTKLMAGMSDAYDEAVMYLDKHLDKVFELLKLYRIDDRTTIILTSDHGQSFGEHGWCGHKVTLYEPEVHVPLIIMGPDIPKGVRVKAQVRNVDIMPTIAAILGGEAKGWAGAPLLPAQRVEGQGNRFAYSCCDYTIYGDVNRLLTCLVTTKRQKYIRVLTTDHKLLREELYDLEADPDEGRNIISANTGLAREISERMDALEASNYWRTTSGGAPAMDKSTRDALKALGYVN